MMPKKGLLILILLLSVKAISGQVFIDLYGDYLGQDLPGERPQVFARGIISSDYKEHGAPSFSPDGNEVFWWTIRLDTNNQWLNYFKTMRRIGDKWTKPEATPYTEAPVFSPDGKRLYFASKNEGDNPYFIEKQGDGWGEPEYLDLVTRFPEIKYVYFPTISSKGTIFFLGYLEDQWANIGIYRTELVNGVYAKPELLPPGINTRGGMRNWTPYIAPDESYLIFCSTRGLPVSDQGDLYISFREADDSWTEPLNMGKQINSTGLERFPSVSPDGKYLFFTQATPGTDEDVYWVSSGIIDRLREKVNSELK
jgi:dipeptidyl aminopeptidase/acylaminoacyl peptidase